MVQKNLNVQILVAYHKPAFLLKNAGLTPIHVGRSIARERSKDPQAYKWLTDNMIGDDTGDNISAKNPFYCELTAVYWAWKNRQALGNPDYVGFMHYRRQFIFDDSKRDLFAQCAFTASGSQYRIDALCDDDIDRLFSERQILDAIDDADVVVARPAEYKISVYQQYVKESTQHRPGDLDKAVEIIEKRYPEFSAAMHTYLNGRRHYFWNMFIMKWDVFDTYCQWLFAILTELEQTVDFVNRPLVKQRALGHLAERLLGIYITYLTQTSRVRIKEKYSIFEELTDLPLDIKPTFAQNEIPVVLAASDNYAPYLGVTIQSIMENSATENNYDIFILNEYISDKNKNMLKRLISGKNNFNLTFVDLKSCLTGLDRTIFHYGYHFAISTYYRFFISRIFGNFEKMLYLDCDLVVLTDIAELYHTPLNGRMLGAAKDMELIRCMQEDTPGYEKWRDYIENTLKINMPENYFQAGVLLLDINKMRTQRFEEQCLARLKEIGKPIYSDQDVLNSLFGNDVAELDLSWNLEWHLPVTHKNVANQLPGPFYESYLKAHAAPKIIHYCSEVKPWNNPSLELAHYFWQYARNTCFYEEILYSAAMPDAFVKTAFNDKNYTLARLVLIRRKLQWRYWRYTILSKINGKRKRERYCLKARQTRQQLKAVRAFCKGRPVGDIYKHLIKIK